MSKIFKKEIVRQLPETGENETEYFVPFSYDHPEDGGFTYIWYSNQWCRLSVSNFADATHAGIQRSDQFMQYVRNTIVARGTALVRCPADSVVYDIDLGNVDINTGCHCFVQRISATSVEDSSHIIASECINEGIRVYFNKKSTSVYYVNYIVFEN